MRSHLCFAIPFVVAVAACSGSSPSNDDAVAQGATAEHGTPSIRTGDVAVGLRRRAEHHVSAVASSGAAARWTGAKLGARAFALHRPDVAGVAYVELSVVAADGSPAGFVTLATAEHDAPIVEWADEGEAPTALLAKRGETLTTPGARVYRIGFERVVEDARGDLVASTTESLDARAWRRARDQFAEQNREAIDATRKHAGEGWAASRAAEAGSLPSAGGAGVSRAATLNRACNVAGFVPPYDQIAPNTPPNDRSYRSGCGATAWSMILAWADNRAAENDSTWGPYKGIYRQHAQLSTSAPDARAPLTFNDDAKALTMEVSRILGTSGGSGGSGDILPTQVGWITGYLDGVGMGSNISVDTWLSSVGAADRVDDSICNRGTPALISVWNPSVGGSNSTFHMVVAHRMLNLDGHRWLFVNVGHGAGGRWFDGTVFVYASLIPQAQPVSPPPRPRGIEVTSATYGGNCSESLGSYWDPTRIFTGNASPDIAASCDGSSDCTYAIDWQSIGNQFLETGPLGDPAYGCAKSYRVNWTCDDGAQRTAFVPAEASGQSVELTCVPRTMNVLSATYGLNCGAPSGNVTGAVAAPCNGQASCGYRVDYRTLGDPAPGCAKNFWVSYVCPGDASTRYAYAAPEAGYGSLVSLSCQ